MNGVLIAAVVVAFGVAAGVVFLITAGRQPAGARVPVPVPAPAPRPRGSLKGTLVMALGAALGCGAMGYAWYAYRPAQLPEQPVAEQQPQAMPGEVVAQPDPQSEEAALANALEYVKNHPDDVDAASFAAHELIALERFDEAQAILTGILAKNPDHVESLVHQAVVDGMRGDKRKALDELKKLAARPEPQATEALLFRGSMALQLSEREIALESFETYASVAPKDQQPEHFDHIITALRAKMGQAQGQAPTAKQ